MTVTTSYQSILDAVEYDALSQEEQESFLADLNSLIFRGTVTRTLERMDDRTKEAWHRLIERGASEEEMRRFLSRHAPEAESALADTVETLAGDILAVTT
jgi:hypothetical protein